MKPVSPVLPNQKLKEVVIAEHQNEYQNLPAIYLENGTILTRWELSVEEKAIVAETGYIYLWMETFGQAVTPVLLTVEEPELNFTSK